MLDSDMIVFATPVYFFSMTAQLKVTIDRTNAFMDKLAAKKRSAVLLAVANNPNPAIMDILKANYLSTLGFLGIEDAGMVLASGCGTLEQTQALAYPEQAYRLGQSIQRSDL